MNCPNCAAVIDPASLKTPTSGEAVMAILKDWKTWAIAFAAAIVANLIAAALSFSPSAGSAGAGAGIGIYIATRLGKMRTCPTCSKTIALPAA